jgi:hypothetical protein
MLFKKIYIAILIVSLSTAVIPVQQLQAQQNKDSTACLIRYKEGTTNSYKIPMTKFCFVRDAGLNKNYTNGWVMKWDIAKKAHSNLLFLEMSCTEVEGWLGNQDISGSVQLVFELPAFSDSISLTTLNYRSKGIHVINNYGGGSAKRYLNGNLKILKEGENTFISTGIDLTTNHPKTRQQFILTNKPVGSFSFDQYQELENKRDSIIKVEHDKLVNALAESIMARDSIWEIENERIKDSLKQHPYTGKFRFWVSDIDKAGYSRITYAITADSLVIKEGPYDFIYLAKNYSKDSIYFKRVLDQNEKQFLAGIEQLVASDSLATIYTNFCIIDGLILSFSFESAQFSKDVTVSNYYNESIGRVVEFINKIAPKKYRLWYDKKILLKQQADCDK